MADSVKMTLNTQAFNARLAQFIQASGQEAEQVTLQVATDVLSDTVENWPVDSGESRAAWIGPQRIEPATYQLSNHTPQAPVIEYGAFRGLGPKTVQFSGEILPGGQEINAGIYSSQVASAPLRRALSNNYQKLSNRLKEALKRSWGK